MNEDLTSGNTQRLTVFSLTLPLACHLTLGTNSSHGLTLLQVIPGHRHPGRHQVTSEVCHPACSVDILYIPGSYALDLISLWSGETESLHFLRSMDPKVLLVKVAQFS